MVKVILVNTFSLLIKRIVFDNLRFALTYFMARSNLFTTALKWELSLKGDFLVSVEVKVIILIKYG